jgi:hypothetical protein
MQSNAEEVINNGWNSNVSLYIFPNTYTPQPRKKNTKTKSFLYKNFGKNGAEAGSGRIVAKKHGREVRHGVFQIASAGVKNGCFAVALLVGRSYLQQDTHYTKLGKNRNTDLTKLYTTDKITDVYTRCGMAIGPVRVDQLHIFYENYLAADLVVFSKAQNDTIVYDSRLDEHQMLHRLTNNVIFYG